MVIGTKFFGEMEIKDKDIIYFHDGMLGLEDLKRYVIIDADDLGKLKCMQSVDEKDIAFIIINPWDIFKDYEVDIDDVELQYFKDKDIKSMFIYTVLTIKDKTVTSNLLGPVVINTSTHLGKQIVLYKSSYTTKHIVTQMLKRD